MIFLHKILTFLYFTREYLNIDFPKWKMDFPVFNFWNFRHITFFQETWNYCISLNIMKPILLLAIWNTYISNRKIMAAIPKWNINSLYFTYKNLSAKSVWKLEFCIIQIWNSGRLYFLLQICNFLISCENLGVRYPRWRMEVLVFQLSSIEAIRELESF